jgi:hypothetical protein
MTDGRRREEIGSPAPPRRRAHGRGDTPGLACIGAPRKSLYLRRITASTARFAGRSRGLRAGRSRGRSDGLRRLSGARCAGAGTALGTARSALVEHRGVVTPVMVPVVTMPGDPEAGEENGCDDEQDPGHNHDPCRQPEEPIWLGRRSGWRCCDRGPRGWCFRCLTHD